MNGQNLKTRILLLAFMLLLSTNGFNTSSSEETKIQTILPKLDSTLPGLVVDSIISTELNQKLNINSFANILAKVNKTVKQ